MVTWRTAAPAAGAHVAHLRTRNGDHEVDFIVEGDNGIVAFEVKLSGSVDNDDVKHLAWLRERLGDDLIDAVVITTGPTAYRRKDGKDFLCRMRAARIGDELKERRIVITYEDITEKTRAQAALERSREQVRNLSTYLQSVREKESTRIAREIHDELGQSLTALQMDVAWLGDIHLEGS